MSKTVKKVLTIRKKILLTTLGLIFIVIITKGYEVYFFDQISNTIQENLNKNWNSLQDTKKVETSYYLSASAISKYIITNDKSWLKVEADAQHEFKDAIAKLKANKEYPEDFTKTINEIDSSVNAFYAGVNQKKNNINSLMTFLKNNNKKSDQIIYKCKELVAYSQRFIDTNNRQIKFTFNQAQVMSGFVALVFIFAIVVLAYAQQRFLVKPLSELLNGIKLIWAGDTEHRIMIDTSDEIGELAKVFNHMAGSIGREQKRLVEKATTDEMTGLNNFRYFQEVLEKEFEKASRFNHDLSFIIMDVDNFKHYNDTNGHQAGDQVLKTVAKLVMNSCRDKDLPARYGGEEFVVVLPGAPLDVAAKVADRIRHAVETTHMLHQEKQPTKNLTISLGVSNYPNNVTTAKELVESADEAMYQSKTSGKNKVTIASKKPL